MGTRRKRKERRVLQTQPATSGRLRASERKKHCTIVFKKCPSRRCLTLKIVVKSTVEDKAF